MRAEGLTVALFATCINDVMFPGTPKAVVTVLERLGCTVEFPLEQTCCGQMFTNTGYFDAAVPDVRNYVKAFSGYDYIVGPSGSCVGAVRHQHPMLAAHSGDEALAAEVDKVVARTYDFTELLVDVLGVTDVGAYFPHRVTYHPTCHSVRVAKVGDRPLPVAVEGEGHRPRAAPRRRPVLRVRRHLLGEEPRRLGRDGRGQGPTTCCRPAPSTWSPATTPA